MADEAQNEKPKRKVTRRPSKTIVLYKAATDEAGEYNGEIEIVKVTKNAADVVEAITTNEGVKAAVAE
jgi:hypothetical protein